MDNITATGETIDITPDFDNLRRFMRLAWEDPANVAFRATIDADPATKAWLEALEPLPEVGDRVVQVGPRMTIKASRFDGTLYQTPTRKGPQ